MTAPQRRGTGFLDQLKKAPWWVWLIFGLFVLGGIGSLADSGSDGSSADEATTTPAKESARRPEPPPSSAAPEPAPEISVDDMVDLVGSAKFCTAYANVLSQGLGEDFAFGNFLRGYQHLDVPGAPSGREVFDELVSRC